MVIIKISGSTQYCQIRSEVLSFNADENTNIRDLLFYKVTQVPVIYRKLEYLIFKGKVYICHSF